MCVCVCVCVVCVWCVCVCVWCVYVCGVCVCVCVWLYVSVYVCMSLMLHVMSVGVCLQEKTYSRANEVAKLEKLMKFVREPLLDKDK